MKTDDSHSSWLVQPVFISSTFLDMNLERDHLSQVVFKKLEEHLLSKRIHLELVDLRWGVKTTDREEQAAKELQVLKVCMDEVDRCQPFIIVILGGRYGWIPPGKRLIAVAREKGFDRKVDVSGKSVTALEIEYGILQNPEQAKHCFFYFREIEGLEKLSDSQKAKYSDQYSQRPDTATSTQKLNDLKETIRKNFPGRVRTYKVHLADKGQQVEDIRAWGDMVIKDIISAFQEEWQGREFSANPSWQNQERWALEEFIELKSKGFAARKELLRRVEELSLSSKESGPQIIAVEGRTGTGKSVFFARLYRELEPSPCLLFANAAGSSLRSGNLDALINRWAFEMAQQIDPNAIDPTEGVKEISEKIKIFWIYLAELSKRQRVIMLLDALDQMEPSPILEHMTWLPSQWPENVVLILTTTGGAHTKAISSRSEGEVISMPPLSQDEAKEVIESICGRYHKAPDDLVIEALLRKKNEEGAPSHANPLWLSIATEQLLLLDEDDFGQATTFDGNEEERLLALMTATADGFRPDIPGLYTQLFQRAQRFGERYDIHWVPDLLRYIAISRYGLRESDLKKLMPGGDNDNFGLAFAMVRRYLRAHVNQRGEIGLWSFTHKLPQDMLRKRLEEEGFYTEYQSNLASHLEGLGKEDELRAREVLHHYLEAGDQEKSFLLFTERNIFAERDISSEEAGMRVQSFSEFLVQKASIGTDRLLDYVDEFLAFVAAYTKEGFDQYEVKPDKSGQKFSFGVEYIAYPIMYLVERFLKSTKYLQNNMSISLALEVLHKLESFLKEGHPRYLDLLILKRYCGMVLSEIGELYSQKNDTIKSLEYVEQYIELAEEAISQNPTGVLLFQLDLLTAYMRKGDYCYESGLKDLAKKYYDKWENYINFLKTNLSSDRDSVFDSELLLLERKGIIKMNDGEYGEAKMFLEKVLLERELKYLSNQYNLEETLKYCNSLDHFAVLCKESGDLSSALEHDKKSIAILEQLSVHYPGQLELSHRIVVLHINTGQVYEKMEAREEALNCNLKAKDMCRELYFKDVYYFKNAQLYYKALCDVGNNQWKLSLKRDYIKGYIDGCVDLKPIFSPSIFQGFPLVWFFDLAGGIGKGFFSVGDYVLGIYYILKFRKLGVLLTEVHGIMTEKNRKELEEGRLGALMQSFPTFLPEFVGEEVFDLPYAITELKRPDLSLVFMVGQNCLTHSLFLDMINIFEKLDKTDPEVLPFVKELFHAYVEKGASVKAYNPDNKLVFFYEQSIHCFEYLAQHNRADENIYRLAITACKEVWAYYTQEQQYEIAGRFLQKEMQLRYSLLQKKNDLRLFSYKDTERLGIWLFNEGRYAQAIPAFQTCYFLVAQRYQQENQSLLFLDQMVVQSKRISDCYDQLEDDEKMLQHLDNAFRLSCEFLQKSPGNLGNIKRIGSFAEEIGDILSIYENDKDALAYYSEGIKAYEMLSRNRDLTNDELFSLSNLYKEVGYIYYFGEQDHQALPYFNHFVALSKGIKLEGEKQLKLAEEAQKAIEIIGAIERRQG